jgi:hypothetical protein
MEQRTPIGDITNVLKRSSVGNRRSRKRQRENNVSPGVGIGEFDLRNIF